MRLGQNIQVLIKKKACSSVTILSIFFYSVTYECPTEDMNMMMIFKILKTKSIFKIMYYNLRLLANKTLQNLYLLNDIVSFAR